MKKTIKSLKPILFCFLISILFLFICSKSSPIYAMNDWVDANCFLTMGKGMAHGLIPYKDLFEQKGPLLYFIHMLSYYIANRSFLGVFLFEVLSFTIFLFFSYKTISLFLKSNFSYLLLPIFAFLILIMPSFKFGDSAEEFSLPFMMISLYYLLFYFKKVYPKPISKKALIINGIMAGCVLWIKYTILGFWIGFMLSIIIIYLKKKQFKELFTACVWFLLGMIISSIPWFIYFGIHHGLYDLFNVYFYINMTSYTSDASILHKLFSAFRLFFSIFPHNNLYFCILMILGLCIFSGYNTYLRPKEGRTAIIICFLLLILGVYGGGRIYRYYFFVFTPFILLFLIIFTSFLSSELKIKQIPKLMITISFIICFALSYLKCPNTVDLKIKKESLVQYQFAEIINKEKTATLLNYGSIDNGFYLTTGIVPNTKYFQSYNIPYHKYPEIKDEQQRYIKEKKTMFIVLKLNPKEKIEDLNIPYLLENYEIIAMRLQKFERKKDKNYVLLKRKETSSHLENNIAHILNY